MTATGGGVCAVSTSGKLMESDPGLGLRHDARPARRRRPRYAAALRVLIEEQPELTVVALAYDGLETLDLADELEPDAVVVDLHMPNMDGDHRDPEAARGASAHLPDRAHRRREPAIHDEATEAGADGVLVKGQMLEALVERLRRPATASGEGRNRTRRHPACGRGSSVG